MAGNFGGTIVSVHRARKGSRTILGLVAGVGLVVALAMPVIGASVTPEFVDQTSNLECDAFEGSGQNWSTLKVDPNPADGAGPFNFTDGTLSVTITNASGDKSFDWSSNIGVDAVYVKAGAGGSHLYRYDPPSESTGDTGLASPGAGGNGISHISFCYDGNDTPESEAPPSEAPPSEAAESEAPASDAPASEAPASEAPASESPREGELGGTPTPAPSAGELPDTAFGDFGQTPATVLSLVLIAALAGMVYVRLARQR
jgi:hypothetical protein